jgi:hypothetical protein
MKLNGGVVLRCMQLRPALVKRTSLRCIVISVDIYAPVDKGACI